MSATPTIHRRPLEALLLVMGALALPGCGLSDHPPTEQEWLAFLEDEEAAREVGAFTEFLHDHQVGTVVDPPELLRQGTDYRKLGLPPFAVPPRAAWPNIVPTLRFIRAELRPRIGEVEVVSAFRTPEYNSAAGGASRSQHRRFSAVDLVPREPIGRGELFATLKSIWAETGPGHSVGLGLYCGTRFHVDTRRYRKWDQCVEGPFRRLLRRIRGLW
jgi:hypothetical protein